VAASALLLAPFFALLLVVFLYPLLSLLSTSFLEPHPGLGNYPACSTTRCTCA
jgi:mannopine transport system permease protein